MARELNCVDWRSTLPTKLVARQRPLSDRKTNFGSFIYSHSSTIPANWVKIGLIDVQIVGQIDSLKFLLKQQHFISPPSAALFAQPARYADEFARVLLRVQFSHRE